MNCKINLVDFSVFARVVYALLPEFTVITGCMRQNRGMHMGSGFRVSVVSGGKCIHFLSKAFISCSFQLQFSEEDCALTWEMYRSTICFCGRSCSFDSVLINGGFFPFQASVETFLTAPPVLIIRQVQKAASGSNVTVRRTVQYRSLLCQC